MLNISLNVDF